MSLLRFSRLLSVGLLGLPYAGGEGEGKLIVPTGGLLEQRLTIVLDRLLVRLFSLLAWLPLL